MDKKSGPHADVVLMGGERVGKTAILHRMLNVTNSPVLFGKYQPTIEDSFMREFLVDDLCCRLRLIDTAGAYEFPEMQRLWLRTANAFIFVCSRDDASSLTKLEHLIVKMRSERNDEPLVVVVVNKCDLDEASWQLHEEEVEHLVFDQLALPSDALIYVSAKEGENIDLIFQALWSQNERVEIGATSSTAKRILFEQMSPGRQRGSSRSSLRRASAFASGGNNSLDNDAGDQSTESTGAGQKQRRRAYSVYPTTAMSKTTSSSSQQQHRSSVQDNADDRNGKKRRGSGLAQLSKVLNKLTLGSPEKTPSGVRTRTDSLGSVSEIDMNCYVS